MEVSAGSHQAYPHPSGLAVETLWLERIRLEDAMDNLVAVEVEEC